MSKSTSQSPVIRATSAPSASTPRFTPPGLPASASASASAFAFAGVMPGPLSPLFATGHSSSPSPSLSFNKPVQSPTTLSESADEIGTVQFRSASTFCETDGAFQAWATAFPSVTIERDYHETVETGVLKAENQLFEAWPSDIDAYLQKSIPDHCSFLEMLFQLQQGPHESEASFRVALDPLFRYVFLNKGSTCVECRTSLPELGSDLINVVPNSPAKIDVAGLRRISFSTPTIPSNRFDQATIALLYTPTLHRFHFISFAAEYKLQYTRQVVNQIILDLLAMSQFLRHLGLRDLELHGLVLVPDVRVRVYAAQIDTEGTIRIIQSDSGKDVDPSTREGFMKFYLLLCRMRAHIETTLVPKCEALTTQAFKNSEWRRAPPKKKEQKKVKKDNSGNDRNSGGWGPADNDDDDSDDSDDNDNDNDKRQKGKGRKHSRSNSMTRTQNKDGARDGGHSRTGAVGYGDNTVIFSPSPQYPLDKEQSILAPEFFAY